METLTPRKLANRIKKEMAEVEAHKAQKPVKELKITIEWRKSRTWGMNPSAEAEVAFKDGTFERRNGYTASGCGYDKESTVIAEIFNSFLRYKLYEAHELKSRINAEKVSHPYGVYYYGTETQKPSENGYISKPSFNGGVGTSCYYDIGKFIGGKFERVASGKTFDVYKYTDN
jgi:hypothetical protein